MKNIIYVFALTGLIFASCKQPSDPQNYKASLPSSFSISGKGLKVITSFINKKQHTMATLYGNEVALQSIKNGLIHIAGEELTLVTWKQQEDIHWFGARIPGDLQSVEVLKTAISQNQPAYIYQRLTGAGLIAVNDTLGNGARIAFMLAQQPSVMP